jgi:hypothetical protein
MAGRSARPALGTRNEPLPFLPLKAIVITIHHHHHRSPDQVTYTRYLPQTARSPTPTPIAQSLEGPPLTS